MLNIPDVWRNWEVVYILLEYGGALLKTGMSSIAKSAFSQGEQERLEGKIFCAIEKAKERFYQKYGDTYGNNLNSFLVNRANEELIFNSLFISSKFPDPLDIKPLGFDGARDASTEVIQDFLMFLKEEIQKNYELDKHFSQKNVLHKLSAVSRGLETQTSSINRIEGSIKVLSQKEITLPEQITNYTGSIIDQGHQEQIHYSRELIKQKKLKEAINYLNWVKERIWSVASPLAKFRITTNMGAAYMSLGDNRKASGYLIEALQYNPNEELATANAAQAYLKLSDFDNARKQALKTLELNPSNDTAYSIIIQILPESEDLDAFVRNVPVHFLDSPEIAFAISIQYRKRNEIDKAIDWLEKGMKNDHKGWSDLRAALGSILLDKSMLIAKEWEYDADLLPESLIEEISRGVTLLTEALDQIADTDLEITHPDWLYNRSLGFFLLGQFSQAIHDIKQAIIIKNEDATYLKLLARYLFINKNYSEALEIIGKFSETDVYESYLLKTEILRKSDINKAKHVLTELINSNEFSEIDIELQRLCRHSLIHIYLEQKKCNEARSFLEQISNADPEYTLNTVYWSALDRVENKETGSIEALTLLANNVPKDLSFQIRKIIADELYRRQIYHLASELYEGIVSVPRNNQITEWLLLSYYRAGLLKKALQLALRLIDLNIFNKLSTYIAATILEDIGDLLKARDIYTTYLSTFPQDYEIALRRALLDYRRGNTRNVQMFLSQTIPFDELQLQDGIAISLLFLHCGKIRDGIDFLYNLRRKFYSFAESHGVYMTSFYSIVPEKMSWLQPKVVTKNAAVCIADESGTKSWFILEESPDTDISKREIPLDHPLALKLLNKKVGSRILLTETYAEPRCGRIKEIISKYVYALRDSQSTMGNVFETVPGVEHIYLGNKFNENPSTLISTIEKLVDDRSEVAQNIEQDYKDGKLSLGCAASVSGNSVINLWAALIQRKGVGIKCFLGQPADYKNAIENLKNPQVLVLDISTILTFHALKLDRVLIKLNRKLVIAQSTLDEFNREIENLKSKPHRAHLVIRKDGDRLVKEEITENEMENKLIYLRRVANWCNKYCQTIPCYEALEIAEQDKKNLVDILGKSFAYSLLIAKQEGGVLVSDDHSLKIVAAQYKILNAWSHALIEWMLEDGFLKKKDYFEAYIQLIQMQYQYTPVNSELVIESARIAEWHLRSPFTEVIEIFSNESSDILSASVVISEVISDLWIQPIENEQKHELIEALIHEILKARVHLDQKVVISYFENAFLSRPNLRRMVREIVAKFV